MGINDRRHRLFNVNTYTTIYNVYSAVFPNDAQTSRFKMKTNEIFQFRIRFKGLNHHPMKPIKGLIIAVLLGLAGYYWGIKEYYVGSKERVHHYEELAAHGVSAIGVLDSTYTEIKIGGIKSYSIKYYFTANGERYSGTHSFGSPAAIPLLIVPVKYMKDNPAINESNKDNDILKRLQNAKESAASKTNLYVGWGLIILSILMITGIIMSIVKSTRSTPNLAPQV